MNFKEFVIINENRSRPCIVVDVQPEYAYWDSRNKKICRNLIQFVNGQTSKILMFINGEESGMSGDTKESVMSYWEDNGFTRDWNNVTIIDKGYGFFRNWMDAGVSDASIIKAIRIMTQNRWNDSRENVEDYDDAASAEKWKKVLNDDSIPFDMISIHPFSMRKLKEYSGSYIMGGGRNECLKEVELLMNAYNIKYKRIDSLVF